MRERIEEELSFLTTLELGVSIEKVKGKERVGELYRCPITAILSV